MPNTREKQKLIELFNTSASMSCEESADYFIAHGVTVQEWISVKDRLPEANQRVLTVDDSGYVVVNCISSRFDGWFSNAFGQKRVTHWMPLPQPPKGE